MTMDAAKPQQKELLPSEVELAAHPLSTTPTAASAPAPARILVVDDHPGIREDFLKILTRPGAAVLFAPESAGALAAAPPAIQPGFAVDLATQGEEAWHMVQEAVLQGRPYALAFVDMRMPPGWDGVETITRLWEVDPELQVVICTAYSDYSWDAITQRLGVTDRLLILRKPFENCEVLQLAHAFARKWGLAREAAQRMHDLDQRVQERTAMLSSSNRQLLQEIADRKEAERRLAAYGKLGHRLSAAKTAREAARIIVEVADELLGWDACLCHMYSAAEGVVHNVLSMDVINGERKQCRAPHDHEPPSPLVKQAIEKGGFLLLRELGDKLTTTRIMFGDTSRVSASILFVPIRNGSQISGVLSIQSYTPAAYTPDSLETLQILADQCGGALERIQAEAELQKAQEQLRQSQKLEAIGQLAGGVAHDFNNLLAVIRGNAELMLMLSTELKDETRECLSQINSAADRAANLTRQLLAFSRKQIMQPKPVNLNDVIGNLTKMLKRIIGENIELQCNYAAWLPMVKADVGMIEQILVNLVVNARDAMPRGGRLTIATEFSRLDNLQAQSEPEARAGRFAVFQVSDGGTGIAPEHLGHIFEPFFTTKEVGKGTGLGLATVYGIVQQHQGWIQTRSQLGLGTDFRIYLPALETETEAKERTPEAARLVGGSETLLLVEDDPAVRTLARRFLQSAGYVVREAASGREALRVVESGKLLVDLLLTDVVMPEGMTGRQLAEQMLLQQPGLKVIFMSGYSGDILEQGTEFVRRISARFLAKPFSASDLLLLVRKSLDQGRPVPAPSVAKS